MRSPHLNIPLVSLAILAFVTIPSSNAGALGTLNANGGAGQPGTVYPTQFWQRIAMPSLTYDWGCWTDSPPNCWELWNGTLTPADIGSTFVVNAASNPNFAQIAVLFPYSVGNSICLSGATTGPVADPGGAACYT